MKRFLVVGLSVLLIIIGLFFIIRFFIIGTKGKGALQITTNIKSTVFLNGKSIGTTPLCKCKDNEVLKEGNYDLAIEPEDPSFEPFTTQIKINKDVLTAVDRTFLPGSLASASILTLEKISKNDPALLVMSIPEGSIVTIDGNSEGVTPYETENITPSEHEVEIQRNGFNKKTLRIKAIPSYKLTAQVILGTQSQQKTENPQPTLPQATQSANLTPTKAQTIIKGETIIRIKDTPTGFLRVRSGPSTSQKEIARVSPLEEYQYIDEQNGWYQIKLSDGEKGWVSASYSEKLANE